MTVWLMVHAGLLNASGPWYLWWSGLGAILFGNLPFLGGVGLLWRHHNCHQPGCWRVARHLMGGYCHRHRPAAHAATEGVVWES